MHTAICVLTYSEMSGIPKNYFATQYVSLSKCKMERFSDLRLEMQCVPLRTMTGGTQQQSLKNPDNNVVQYIDYSRSNFGAVSAKSTSLMAPFSQVSQVIAIFLCGNSSVVIHPLVILSHQLSNHFTYIL